MQVFGGHGYIQEGGMDQYVRDARINMIYEGTNTIQSLDLLGRKVLADGGAKLRLFGAHRQGRSSKKRARDADMAEFVKPLVGAEQEGREADAQSSARAPSKIPKRWAPPPSTTCGSSDTSSSPTSGRAWPRSRSPSRTQDPFYKAKLATARFYFGRLIHETEALVPSVRSGAGNLLSLEADLF